MFAQLLLGTNQLLPQPGLRLFIFCQFGFKPATALVDLARQLFSRFPTLGFLGQRFAQALELVLNAVSSRLQFLSLRFQPDLLGGSALLLRLELLLHILELMAQLAQLHLLVALLFTSLDGLALSLPTTLGLLGQCVCQML